MSGGLTTLIVLGVVVIGFVKRCEWFGICGNILGSGGPNPSPPSVTDDSTTSTDTPPTADTPPAATTATPQPPTPLTPIPAPKTVKKTSTTKKPAPKKKKKKSSHYTYILPYSRPTFTY